MCIEFQYRLGEKVDKANELLMLHKELDTKVSTNLAEVGLYKALKELVIELEHPSVDIICENCTCTE